MNTFDDRKKAFESKFANDAEMQFKVMAKRNKFVGLWAAELLGKSGDDAEVYAKEVIKSDMEEAGDEGVIRKVQGDLGGLTTCLLYTSPSPRDVEESRMPSSA